MADRLPGKIAFDTSIGGGIGKGCALKFAREGASVVGCDINTETVQATVAEATRAQVRSQPAYDDNRAPPAAKP